VKALHHVPAPDASPPADEAQIRHHERQLCATELLILAEKHHDPSHGGSLILAAVAISRREVV
jgi:hypothetical protein